MQEDVIFRYKNGRIIPIKVNNTQTTNEHMNNIIRGENKNIIEAVHYTNKNNLENILENGFNLDRAGEEAGSTFGNGVYFTNKENEKLFYQNRISNSTEIKADIDTKGFLIMNYDGYASRKGKTDIYEQLSKVLKADEQKEYRQRVKEITASNEEAVKTNNSSNYSFDVKKDAIIPIIQKNYPGIIINQNTEALDIITGGNQIVVYDLDRIKVRK